MKEISETQLASYRHHLAIQEKAPATQKCYLRDVAAFAAWLGAKELTKDTVLAYKTYLCAHYATASVNSALCSLNSFFSFVNRADLRVKTLKLQKAVFATPDTELTQADYRALLAAASASGNDRLFLLLETLASSGIRVSEIPFITREAVAQGTAEIACKGKRRTILLPEALCTALAAYATRERIKSGPVFVTRSGRPLDRSNIWSEMKRLAARAGIPREKVFPHNFRHLFARTYYEKQRDIVRLADILGHGSINTTRIYTTESGETHRRQLEELGFVIDLPPKKEKTT